MVGAATALARDLEMTQVLITVDTEFSALLHQKGITGRANFESSILGRCRQGDFGINWQMDQMESHGIKGVFFVDPMPALVYDTRLIAEIVAPIIARGHEVQLHIHTEWLQWVVNSPVDGRTGRNLADFSIEDQITLLTLAADMVEKAGAPRPTAFRAGNYGADDNSLRALAKIGLTWDSSVNPAYLGGGGCLVSTSPSQISAMRFNGIVELPVSALLDRPDHVRPAQVCALSAWEMRAALRHSAKHHHPTFVIVTHSFEMLSRDRLRANRSVQRRFVAMCQEIETHPGLESAGFADLDPTISDVPVGQLDRLAPKAIRTGLRVIEQGVATLLYERRA
jgi:peptidoglycan/xylan/chitin deacetylase (PgdA/CDA1 family)